MPPLPPVGANNNTQNNVNGNVNMNGNQNQNQNQQQFILNQVNTNKMSQKPIMHWNLYPDKNKKSQLLNGPLFILKS